jgi:hypothetical protein
MSKEGFERRFCFAYVLPPVVAARSTPATPNGAPPFTILYQTESHQI